MLSENILRNHAGDTLFRNRVQLLIARKADRQDIPLIRNNKQFTENLYQLIADVIMLNHSEFP